MRFTTIEATDARVVSKNIHNEINGLVRQLRSEIDEVAEPRFQALLETAAEVLIGLGTAFRDYTEKPERAWGTK